jgi:hypothetical protein
VIVSCSSRTFFLNSFQDNSLMILTRFMGSFALSNAWKLITCLQKKLRRPTQSRTFHWFPKAKFKACAPRGLVSLSSSVVRLQSFNVIWLVRNFLGSGRIGFSTRKSRTSPSTICPRCQVSLCFSFVSAVVSCTYLSLRASSRLCITESFATPL